MDSRRYVGWTPLSHEPGYEQAGWLVHERSRDVLDGTRLELWFVCSSCGAVHLLRVDTDARPDARWGVRFRKATSTRRIGNGCPPRRAVGLAVAGPGVGRFGQSDQLCGHHGQVRRERREEIAGAVARYRTVCGAHRWLAAVSYDPAVENRDGFRSASAAAAWLAERLTSGADSRAVGPRERSGVDR